MTRVIGIAGKMGSGKSTVSRWLAQQGFAVIDADSEAHRLYKEDSDLRNKLSETFGESILTPTGVDRARLATIVFQDEKQLRKLEDVVHPVLQMHLQQLVKSHSSPWVFLEAALLPRWPDFTASLDEVWDVVASESVRLQRVVLRGLEESAARDRMASQLNLANIQHAHRVVIPNEGAAEELYQFLRELMMHNVVKEIDASIAVLRSSWSSQREKLAAHLELVQSYAWSGLSLLALEQGKLAWELTKQVKELSEKDWAILYFGTALGLLSEGYREEAKDYFLQTLFLLKKEKNPDEFVDCVLQFVEYIFTPLRTPSIEKLTVWKYSRISLEKGKELLAPRYTPGFGSEDGRRGYH